MTPSLSQPDQSRFLVPDVLSRESLPGEFLLTPATAISAEGPGAGSVAELLASYWRPSTGFPLRVADRPQPRAQIHLSCSSEKAADPEFPDESYTLEVTTAGVQLNATHPSGLARGVQTLRQLMCPRSLSARPLQAEWNISSTKIEDRPRFPWRGMHLDVARHFFTVDQVCRFIDLIALHRFNRLHLHLTDDQGWRIEIRKYPKLTEVGAWRPCTVTGPHEARPRRYDNKPHGGFFTHDDIRHIVEFAGQRHIHVVPEIDMPGHMVAAIAAYPELGNGRPPREPRCHWGISNEILNMEPETLAFAKDVLGEVLELFPGRFIHIGGDEVPKYEWENCRRIQARMLELGLGNELELQGWFNRQIAEFLADHGRSLVGWDEIVESGLPAGAVVMNWRGENHGLEAARMGHDVVGASSEFAYFDFYQSDPIREEPQAIGREITAGRVYAYDPIPAGLEPENHHHILGGQGQLWSEYIATPGQLDYMAFPRTCALAEVLWLPSQHRTYRDFLSRLSHHRERLEALAVNAHPLP
jgi:hexosaminidase